MKPDAICTSFRSLQRLAGAFALLLILSGHATVVDARVLTDAELQRISEIRKLSVEVMTDLTMSARRTDLTASDNDCVRSTLRMLTQVSEELQSYENLIAIESQLEDTGDDTSMRSILRFAVENALKVLNTERSRLAEIAEQCSRHPFSAAKARLATQFIESIAGILKSVQPRL
jgi:hypothetical protein